MKRWWMVMSALCLLAPAMAQDSTCALPARLAAGDLGQVLLTDGAPLNVRDSASRNGTQVGQVAENDVFAVTGDSTCEDGIRWWPIEVGQVSGWIAEGVDGHYLVSPANTLKEWDWSVALGEYDRGVPDPTTITLPTRYAGDMPTLPVDLGGVTFVDEANLNVAQTALLTQNGFVVTPGTEKRFHDVYRGTEAWSAYSTNSMGDVDANGVVIDPGQGIFITTDSVLSALYDVFHQVLAESERTSFYPDVQRILIGMTNTAQEQYAAVKGTPLEGPARDTLVYLATGLQLAQPDDEGAGTIINLLDTLDPEIVSEAQALTDQIVASDGQSEISFFNGYVEDFGSYRVRGHYEGDANLERYFRTMNWLGRITFRAKDADETLSALLLVRALALADQEEGDSETSYDRWLSMHDTLTYIVGPSDDLTPIDYLTLAKRIYGDDLSLEALSDTSKLQAFREELGRLPGPRINGLVLAADTSVDDVDELTTGFRLMGQRFTFDGYVLGRLFAPYVGDRILPSAVDVPVALGSDVAVPLTDGPTFATYATEMGPLQAEVSVFTEDDWQQTFYSGWLHALLPLWDRHNDAAYPPMMSTEAWKRRELQTGLASYTQLKHATVLYAKQPTGFGGGGPPLLAYGYVEPNPLAFARISILSESLYRNLVEHGVMPDINNMTEADYGKEEMATLGHQMHALSRLSATLASIARKELAGEPLTDSEYFFIQENFSGALQLMDAELYDNGGGEPPPPVALVTDIATNASFARTVQIGIGAIDYIYVVIPTPAGYQVARGGVFSYYEFVGDSNERLTDSAWRASVEAGTLPPRPLWTSAFYSE